MTPRATRDKSGLAERVRIKAASESDLAEILAVTRAAFDSDVEADLVRRLVNDPTARPVLSLLATKGGRAVGHILFTAARWTRVDSETQRTAPSLAILAPLSVVPVEQRRGVGGRLIESGLARLAASGVDLVFVLGHPAYYPRHDFVPAGRLGFEAPYPIPERHADAWMVKALSPDMIGSVRGKVACADVLNDPVYWRE